ncbi:predicted protein [Naegleria gruberi]|uniref:DNA replication licensing factor MCM2 n=1 Tax=Naegleria gruberi TaxID=5762 RepID=D2VX76_NAEGR|nr:uncharacterized protein NAEGRDRAFT_73646 [Naegleria gruberi]EFC38577.1 predicted protein [Naegleria gruberi]|eukprot:XP_002671321.1 predicted protein [Naegleria gruberi strain NEG-M]
MNPPEDVETQEYEEEIPFDEEEEEGEDLFADDVLEEDYTKGPTEEDFYDEQYIDNTTYHPMSYHDRLNVENLMNSRDEEEEDEIDQAIRRSENKRKSLPSSDDAILHLLGDDNTDESHSFEEDEEDDGQTSFDEIFTGDIREKIAMERTRALILKGFRRFFTEEKREVYMEAIKHAVANNKKSIVVNFTDLSVAPHLLLLLTDLPDATIELMEEAVNRIVELQYPNYVGDDFHIRIKNLPTVESIRDLRHSSLNQLISVRGVVTRRTAMFPQLKFVKYDCVKCGESLSPIIVRNASDVSKPSSCPGCAGKNCFIINEAKTIYSNYQKITIQEPPGTVPAGRIPRSKDVILVDDLIDCTRPGEEVIVTGVYKQNYDAFLNVKQGFPVFATIIEANYVEKIFDKRSEAITKEDERKIQQLAKNPHIQEKIIKSIAPSIFGHEDIKKGIALSLFGGVRRVSEEHTTRGDINVLLLGDPGTAKSQILKYIEKTATRAVFTTGKGSSAVGLTASVKKDPINGEWTLEGGALVLADEGVCMIDEFDKMNDQDRTSIHEAMEQQSISISKAGIVTTLQARCAVIAAANPIRGRYDPSKTFHQNVELSEPILSRFDILFIVRDTVDEKIDENLAKFVVNSHFNSHPKQTLLRKVQEQEAARRELLEEKNEATEEDFLFNKEGIPQDMFKKYLMMAKRIRPNLSGINKERLTKFYSELRKHSEEGSGLTITARHLESIIRMSEASAKMHLRSTVNDSDVNTAISVMLESFISTQKYSVAGSLKRKFKRYLQSPTDDHQLLLHILNEMVKTKISSMADEDEEEEELSISIKEFKNEVAKNRIFDISTFLDNEEALAKKGFTVSDGTIFWKPQQ